MVKDFRVHNREVKEIWDSFNARKPVRVPIVFGISTRYYIFNDELNPKKISFKEYTENPDVMLERQLYHQYWARLNIPQDAEMGLPEKGWGVGVDFQNYYEAGWIGCPVKYIDGEVPDTQPILNDDNKNMLFDKGIPDPFSGLMAKNREYYEYFLEKKKNFIYKGLPVADVVPSGVNADGPFTVACSVRGASEICLDIKEDPEFVKKLLDYLADATITRIKSWRKYIGHDEMTDSWGFADDSIQLLSTDTYREFILPVHKKLVNAFSRKGPNSIHLCGDASRHFKMLKEELNIMSFDTGFPIDLGKMRKELGPDVQLNGGPHVQFLKEAEPEEVEREIIETLNSGVMEGGRFVLREGNNLAPGTPVRNLEVMYETGKKHGKY